MVIHSSIAWSTAWLILWQAYSQVPGGDSESGQPTEPKASAATHPKVAAKKKPSQPAWQRKPGRSQSDPDSDGLHKEADLCPMAPEDIDGFEDMDGCPDYDNDHDGIRDSKDACPREAEIFNNKRDGDGCPDGKAQEQLFMLDKTKIQLKDTGGRFFRGSTTRLHTVGRQALSQIASFLKTCPHLQELKVWALDDPKSIKPRLKNLAHRRAKLIVNFLRRKGVSRKRLTWESRNEDYLTTHSPARDPQNPDEISLELVRPLSIEAYLKAKMLDHKPSPKHAPSTQAQGGMWILNTHDEAVYVPNYYNEGLDKSRIKSNVSIERR
jgi:hypothetical protein